jgi:hypothetical protein
VTPDDGDRIVRRLAALSDLRQRVAILGEEATRLGPEGFADLLAVVIDRANERKSERDLLGVEAVMGFLDSSIFTDRQRVELLAVSREYGYEHLLRLLFAPQESHKEEVARVPDYGTGRPLTLGERKSLARKPLRDVLERVLADPHPAVIHNVLRNPKLTEGDVLRLVSRRPNYADALREVYFSAKWGRRYPIKVALARNPYTPPDISLKLLHQLMRQDLLEIIQDRGLHDSVLSACKKILNRDEGRGSPGDDGETTLH